MVGVDAHIRAHHARVEAVAEAAALRPSTRQLNAAKTRGLGMTGSEGFAATGVGPTGLGETGIGAAIREMDTSKTGIGATGFSTGVGRQALGARAPDWTYRPFCRCYGTEYFHE